MMEGSMSFRKVKTDQTEVTEVPEDEFFKVQDCDSEDEFIPHFWSSDSEDEVPEIVNLPSVGSKDHHLGLCKPCSWFFKAAGCLNGRDCLHCHLCPKSAVKSRKKLKANLRKAAQRPEAPPGLPPPGQVEVGRVIAGLPVEVGRVMRTPYAWLQEGHSPAQDVGLPPGLSLDAGLERKVFEGFPNRWLFDSLVRH
ncbi:unnamed protein product [Effrenium voratum]|nr:unnamed protein product [Effrenium voratum]